jgi:hypothetical protein
MPCVEGRGWRWERLISSNLAEVAWRRKDALDVGKLRAEGDRDVRPVL